MKIEHIALWVRDVEKMAEFYARHFDAVIGPLYHNPRKQFTSRFLQLGDGCRVELMHRPNVQTLSERFPLEGYAHIALSVGSQEQVDAFAQRWQTAGGQLLDGPRWTGDGYYECVVADIEGNLIEVTI